MQLRLQIRFFAAAAGKHWASNVLRDELAAIEHDLQRPSHRPQGASGIRELELIELLREKSSASSAPTLAEEAMKSHGDDYFGLSKNALTKKIIRTREAARKQGGFDKLHEHVLFQITKRHIQFDTLALSAEAGVSVFEELRPRWLYYSTTERWAAVDPSWKRLVTSAFGLELAAP